MHARTERLLLHLRYQDSVIVLDGHRTTVDFWVIKTPCKTKVGSITFKTVTLKAPLISYAAMENLSIG